MIRVERSKRETFCTCAAWLGLFYALAVFGGMEQGMIEIGQGFVRVIVTLAVTLAFCWGAEILGIKRGTISSRVYRGWKAEKALSRR